MFFERGKEKKKRRERRGKKGERGKEGRVRKKRVERAGFCDFSLTFLCLFFFFLFVVRSFASNRTCFELGFSSFFFLPSFLLDLETNFFFLKGSINLVAEDIDEFDDGVRGGERTGNLFVSYLVC